MLGFNPSDEKAKALLGVEGDASSASELARRELVDGEHDDVPFAVSEQDARALDAVRPPKKALERLGYAHTTPQQSRKLSKLTGVQENELELALRKEKSQKDKDGAAAAGGSRPTSAASPPRDK